MVINTIDLLDAYVKASEGKEPVMLQQAADYHDFVKWEKELLDDMVNGD
jgi:polyketide synthase PksN